MINIFNKKIGFDCDDCVIDCLDALIRVAKFKYNVDITKPRDFDLTKLGLSSKQVDDIIISGLTDWENVKPIDGGVNFIKKYYKHTKNPPVFITYRGNWIPISSTYSWLNYWIPNIPYKVHFAKHNIPKSKYVIEDKIDVYIEDRLECAIEISDYCELVILIGKPWNENPKHNKKNIIRINNWNEIYNISI